MNQYRVEVFFNGTRDQLVMLLDEGDEYRLRAAAEHRVIVNDLKRHGFIKGNDLGIRVSVNTANIDYLTSEIYVPKGLPSL